MLVARHPRALLSKKKLPYYSDVKHLVQYLKKSFNISDELCERKRVNILIINRNKKGNRNITNVMDLQIALSKQTRQNVYIAYLERLSVRKQMQIIQCTDIMIGVHGAGLAWYLFFKIQ